MGWYCWTDDPNAPDPAGDYWVPTYDFGDIEVGQSVTRQLAFGLYAPEDPAVAGLGQFLEEAELNNYGSSAEFVG